MNREVSLSLVTVAELEDRDSRPGVVRRFGMSTAGVAVNRVGHVARIYDIDSAGGSVFVVAEPAPRMTLSAYARLELPGSPTQGARAAHAVRHLAVALRSAHRVGAVMSLDHPGRIRITEGGTAVFAFPASDVRATKADDLRGLGAVLFALLTGTWPLGSEPVSGMQPTPRMPDGSLASPHALRPAVSPALSTLAVETVSGVGPVRNVEQFVVALDAAVHEPPQPVDDRTENVRRFVGTPRARVASVLAAVALLAGFGTAGWFIATGLTGGTYGEVATTAQTPGLDRLVAEPEPVASPVDAPTPLIPSGAVVFSPQQTRDNAGDARLAIDADPATAWFTDPYWQQFPVFKDGVGLVVSFPAAVDLASVWVDSGTPGTVVEIRTAPGADGSLAGTRVLGRAELGSGVTTIATVPSEPAREVLVWITELAPSGTKYASSLAEIGFGGT